jgi:hypothetical protein
MVPEYTTHNIVESTLEDVEYLNLCIMKPNEYNRFLYDSLYCLIIRFRDNLTVCGDRLIAISVVDEHERECESESDECNHTVHSLQDFYTPKDLRSLHWNIEIIALNNDVFPKSQGGGKSLLFSMYYELLNDLSSWSLLSYEESITDTIDEEVEKLKGKRRKKQVKSYIVNSEIFDTEKRKEMVEKIMKNVLTARGYVLQALSNCLGM